MCIRLSVQSREARVNGRGKKIPKNLMNGGWNKRGGWKISQM